VQFEKDLESPFKRLFLEIRHYILLDKDVTEIKKERITTYHYQGSGLCHLRTMPNGVDIGFMKGVQLTDKQNLLVGNGKKIRILTLKFFSESDIFYYLDQAKLLNIKG